MKTVFMATTDAPYSFTHQNCPKCDGTTNTHQKTSGNITHVVTTCATCGWRLEYWDEEMPIKENQ